MKIEKYLRTIPDDKEFTPITPARRIDVGNFQLYLYPADVMYNGDLYHELIITEFDDYDMEKSHKLLYIRKGTQLVLPRVRPADVVKEMFEFPQGTRLEFSKERQAPMGCRKEIPGFKPYISINGVIVEGKGVFNTLEEHDKQKNSELLDKLHVKLCNEYFPESNEEWNRAIDRVIEIVKEIKSEVSNEG